MKKTTALAVAALMACAGLAHAETMSLSQDWRFHKGDVADGSRPDLDESGWRMVVVPHDFSIEDGADGRPPFDPKTAGAADSGYIRGGIGWYRRHLRLDRTAASQVVLLDFEAVYMDAEIWVNGERLAVHHYGYTAFQVDLTGHVHEGDNLIAVRVDHEDPSSRWYAGSGIIRPVSLELHPKTHIGSDGPTVTTPKMAPAKAEIQVVTPLVNSEARPVDVVLATRILDADGRVVATASAREHLEAGARASVRQRLQVADPRLWDTDSPYLYHVAQSLTGGGAEDDGGAAFGIRTIRLDPARGLLLNGKRVLLRGGNIHHDSYMLGAASFPRAEERKLEWMKAAGYNAVRSAHNPLSQASLDAADRLGLLVIDEAFDAWSEPKRDKDYARYFAADWQQDLRSLVISGRNHPSVLAWSIGNEIPEQVKPKGAEEAAMLASFVRKLDSTRPITQAVSSYTPDTARLFAQLDIGGYNYFPQSYGPDHKAFPRRLMMSTESYPDGVFDYWQPTRTMPWVLGDFVWTAVDYLGEASIGGVGYTKDWDGVGPYPWHLAWCGEIDAIGRMRPNAYYRRIVWGDSDHPVAAFVRRPGPYPWPIDNLQERHLAWVMQDLHPNWTWPGFEGKPLEVVVYSELPEIELFLNGRSLGRKAVSEADRYQTSFTVPYEPGTLRAVGYRDGKPAADWTLETTGAPAALRLSVDRRRLDTSGLDLGFVTAELVDAQGRVIYDEASDKTLRFEVAGAGVLAGVGNGKPYGTESFQSGVRTTFHGEAVAAVRAGTSPGAITVKVSAEGLPAREIVLEAGR
jgi:beta-galactosidase